MKNRSSIIILGVMLMVFAITSIGAVGSIPTSYNQSAQDILKMLWGKLDAAYTANYQARMLVRYHDHEGTNPGDFTSRGLPIATNGIENSAVTGAKLSTAAKTKIVTAQVGNLAAGTGVIDEKAVFVAPGSATITRVTFTTSNTVTQSDTNYTQLMLVRRRAGVQDGVATASVVTANWGSGFTAWVPVEATINQVDGRYPALNDVYTLYKSDIGSGRATDDLLVTIEYTINN